MKIFRRFGSVCTWGSGKYLGHNKPPGTHVKTPTIIQNRGNGEKFDEDIIALSEGLNHCGLVTKTGELYMFGKNDSLQLGSHLEKHSLAPMKIPNIPLIKQVSCGTNFTISLSREGEVYSWGCAGSKGYHCKDDTAVPRKIESIEETIIQIASGDSHSLALSQEGSVYAWGSNLSGAVGDELMNFHLQTPIKIAFFENLAEKVVKICAGNQSSAALTQNGKVYVWGNNENYEIGVDDEELIGFHHIWTPSLIKISESNFIKDICLGENSLMMLSNIDIIFVSGFKIWQFATKFDIPSTSLPKQILCGKDYFAVLCDDDSVIYYGGPFIPEYYKLLEYPDATGNTSQNYFPGKVKFITGRYDYCAAIIDK